MRSRRAFSLVELLVVITIIGLLIGMLLPTISMVQEALTRLHCKTNLKKVHGILMAYAGRFEGRLPPFGTTSIVEAVEGVPGGTPAGRHLMIETLLELGATPEYFCCPAHPRFAGLDDSAYYRWEPAAYQSNYASKWFSVPGYVFLPHTENFRRHPTGGNVTPNHWATWSRFIGGRFLPQCNDDVGNPPVAADITMIDDRGYWGFWHFPTREALSESIWEERCYIPGGGGHTLFLAGDVVWFDWGELEEQGAAYEANNDHFYYFGLEKPGQ